MKDLPFDQFADFVREWGGLSRKKKIAPESEFEADLGITGDDGCDLLEARRRPGMSTVLRALMGSISMLTVQLG
jgi:hypothetical protein